MDFPYFVKLVTKMFLKLAFGEQIIFSHAVFRIVSNYNISLARYR